MSRPVRGQSRAVSAARLWALAVGAAAFGGRRWCTGDRQACLVIKKARFNELEVDDWTVHRLRVTLNMKGKIRDAEACAIFESSARQSLREHYPPAPPTITRPP